MPVATIDSIKRQERKINIMLHKGTDKNDPILIEAMQKHAMTLKVYNMDIMRPGKDGLPYENVYTVALTRPSYKPFFKPSALENSGSRSNSSSTSKNANYYYNLGYRVATAQAPSSSDLTGAAEEGSSQAASTP
jgi:hypothetical protein